MDMVETVTASMWRADTQETKHIAPQTSHQALWYILSTPSSSHLCFSSVSLWLQFSMQCIPNQSNCGDRMMVSSRWQWPRCFGHIPRFLLLFPPLHVSEPPPVFLPPYSCTSRISEFEGTWRPVSVTNKCDQITTGIKCYINKHHLCYRRSWW